MDILAKVRENLVKDISNERIIKVLFEMSKYKDKQFTQEFRMFQKSNSLRIDSYNKNVIRKAFYYDEYAKVIEKDYTGKLPKLEYNNIDLQNVLDYFSEKIQSNREQKIIQSIIKRITELETDNNEIFRSKSWLNNYEHKYEYSNITLKYDLKNKNDLDDTLNELSAFISEAYKKLDNYRYLQIIFENDLNIGNRNLTMTLISKVAVYMENFLMYRNKFHAFNSNKKKEDLIEFLNGNDYIDSNIDLTEIVKFYEGISHGFQYEDFLVSKDTKTKILVMRKIELDETPIACPACLEKNARGNSYPSVFLKSWECSNPSCPERSKSGRGKRFDEYGTYRYFKLILNEENNQISDNLYKKWRKDIFEDKTSLIEMIIMFYTYSGEKILFVNENISKHYGRSVVNKNLTNVVSKENTIDIKELPIIKIFSEISKSIKTNNDNNEFSVNSIIHGDSREILSKIKNTISGAITSPPYYNAREYSQWKDFNMYLIDMMINAKYVYDSLKMNSTYIYNIADIIDQDNVYVESHMSKRRIMLGFYSAIIFEIIGFKLVQDIFWYKGEVQSKRNSTANHFSGYLKFINCYEHNLVFKKGDNYLRNPHELVEISPVIKINNKGENTFGHTAPFPESIADLIAFFLNKGDLVLDPFSGSGTTAIWAKKNGYKYITIELNKEYYELSIKRISNEHNDIDENTLFNYRS
jgi:DNA modification methylase